MTEFETVRSEEFRFDDDRFIQLARKKAVSAEGEEEYIALASGVYSDDTRRVKNNFSLPLDDDVLQFLLDALPELLD